MNRFFLAFGILFSVALLAMVFVLVSCTGRLVVEDQPVLLSPINNSSEALGLGSLFRAPAPAYSNGYHKGIDISFTAEASVVAAATGEVVEVNDSNDSYGPIKTITVRYNDKYQVKYVFEPLLRLSISMGTKLQPGQLIGTLGVREVDGRAVSWLHFELDEYGQAVCPVQFMSQAARQQFEELYNLDPTEGLVDPCYEHPTGCPSLH